MKIFITGGTGFIGSRLTEKLLQLGHEVVVLIRDPSKVSEKKKKRSVIYMAICLMLMFFKKA